MGNGCDQQWIKRKEGEVKGWIIAGLGNANVHEFIPAIPGCEQGSEVDRGACMGILCEENRAEIGDHDQNKACGEKYPENLPLGRTFHDRVSHIVIIPNGRTFQFRYLLPMRLGEVRAAM